jgi:hypothetical protein
MNETQPEVQNRRQWLRGVLRGAALTALATLSAVLWSRRADSIVRCDRASCGECPLLARCDRPRELKR